MLTGFTGLECSCDIRWAHVWLFVLFSPFVVTVGYVRAKSSVRPHTSNDVVMHEVFKWNVFYFIGLGHTKNYIVLYELRQYWFKFFAMYKTRVPNSNVMKKLYWEKIKLCTIFGGKRPLSRTSGRFKGGRVV